MLETLLWVIILFCAGAVTMVLIAAAILMMSEVD
jgi:hypothetical protein